MATSSDGQRADSNIIDEFADYREELTVTGHSVDRAGGERLSSFYDTWVERYHEMHVTYGWLAPRNLAALASEFITDKSSRILDAASGTGMVGQELKNLGFTCIDALDPSQKSLDQCKEQKSHTEYICDTLDEHQTKIQDNQYDAVVIGGAFGVPGHVSDSCFPELIRVTKPGGYIMFTLSDKVKDEWDTKLEAAIAALNKQGRWEVADSRRIQYNLNEDVDEKATVPVLRMHVACGYLAPRNLAALASEFITDKSSRILDAASGTGMVGQELKNLGFTCIDALDPSQKSLDQCKEQKSHTEYICDTLDEHQTKIQDNQYDAVVIGGAFGVPGHVSDSCFPELIRVTKPGKKKTHYFGQP
ncbi:uncharacterized protein LOC119727671 isoform X2 [Patiria miniata]|uniref:Methyltransferase domain-containing protein n=1 Tax=Patiria miniata TaxID=46514 RepID=A0A913ZVN0_PATMI|nr:uncharacterized protein LOC119727671 isoform X2 [Patiria miniata]